MGSAGSGWGGGEEGVVGLVVVGSEGGRECRWGSGGGGRGFRKGGAGLGDGGGEEGIDRVWCGKGDTDLFQRLDFCKKDGDGG